MAELTPQEQLNALESATRTGTVHLYQFMERLARILVDQQAETQALIRQSWRLERTQGSEQNNDALRDLMFLLHEAAYRYRFVHLPPGVLKAAMAATDADSLRGYQHILRDARALLDALEQELPPS